MMHTILIRHIAIVLLCRTPLVRQHLFKHTLIQAMERLDFIAEAILTQIQYASIEGETEPLAVIMSVELRSVAGFQRCITI